MLFSDPRRDMTFTLLHEEVMCMYNTATLSHRSHHQKTPGLLWGVQEPLLESAPAPCLVRIPEVPPASCCTANSFLMLSNNHSWSPQTSPGIQQRPPGCQERLEKSGTPPLRHLIWSITQLEVQKHHQVFQVFPESQRINT